MTIEEIKKGLEENPEMKKDLIALVETDAVEHLKTKGHVIRTKDEENQFLSDYEKSKIDPRVNEIYTQLDKDILAITGVKKDGSEKTYDYLKRVVSPIVNEVKDLKKQIADGLDKNGDELTKQQLKQLQEKLTEKENELTKLQDAKVKEVSEIKQQHAIDRALLGKKIVVPSTVADDKKEAYLNSRRDFIADQFKKKFTAAEQDGKVVYKQGDTIVLNKKTNQPMSAEEIIMDEFSYEFEAEKGPKGAGGSGGGAGAGSADEAEVTDKETLLSFLSKKGFVFGSREWSKEAERIAKEKNIKL